MEMEMSKVLVANPTGKKCRAFFAFVNIIATLGARVFFFFLLFAAKIKM